MCECILFWPFLSFFQFSLSISHFRKRSNCDDDDDDGEFAFAFNDNSQQRNEIAFCTLEFVDHAGVDRTSYQVNTSLPRYKRRKDHVNDFLPSKFFTLQIASHSFGGKFVEGE